MTVAAWYLAWGLAILDLPVPASILLSFTLALLLLASVVGVSVLFGSVFRNGSTAVAATVLVLVVGSFGTQGFFEQASVEPWFLITYATRVLTAVLPPSYPAQIQEAVQPGGFPEDRRVEVLDRLDRAIAKVEDVIREKRWPVEAHERVY